METPDWPLLARYLAGEADEQTQRTVEQWAAESPANATELANLRRLWADRPASRPTFKPLAETWAGIAAQLETEKPAPKTISLRPLPTRRKSQLVWRVAAAVALLALIGWGGYWYQRHNQVVNQAVVWKKTETQAKQRLKLTLPDGSRVWLNANSRLEYPETFSEANREVQLVGEAYFEVAHRPTQPFLVRAGAGGQAPTVRVLGTKFNLNTTNDEGQVETVLAEGKVAFEVPGQAANPLAPNELLAFDPQTQQIEKHQVDVAEYTGWKDGQLTFKNETMRRVVRRLERFYGVDIEVQNPNLLRCRITANFNNQPITNVLDYLKTLTQADYQMQNEQVKLSGGKCK
jgi:ferric-dicitrate binding protein FerR (iron transport regulator)